MPNGADPGPLSQHEEQTVDAIADFHRDHYRSATPVQRVLDAAVERLGRPTFVLVMILGLLVWIALAQLSGHGGVTDPAFAWLELAATVASLLVAMLILATQRREDELSDRRAKLTLELAVLADHKTAKIIALLEELRRDAPGLADRIDGESEDLAKPTDPNAVLAAIDERVRPEKPKPSKPS